MITEIKNKNKVTKILFDDTGSAVNVRAYNTYLKNQLTVYAAIHQSLCVLLQNKYTPVCHIIRHPKLRGAIKSLISLVNENKL